jgi:hypothetical protein
MSIDLLFKKFNLKESDPLIEIINNNKKEFEIFIEKSIITSKKFPPKYNENKFIYGKLVEHLFVNSVKLTNNQCILLDEDKLQSNYKNDICVNNEYFYSLKVTKNRNGNVRLINNDSEKVQHIYTNINMVIINLERIEIYLFNTSQLPIDYFKINKDGIDIKSKFYKYIQKI